MSVLGSRVKSRSAAVLVVAAVHVLILCGIWRVRTPVKREVETFVSMLPFVAQTPAQRLTTASTLAARHAAADRLATGASGPGQLPAAPVAQPLELPTAITPAAPAGRVDWSGQIEAAARAELDQEAKAREQLRALTRRFEMDPDPRNTGPRPSSTFRWYGPGIHRVDTSGPLPVLLLNDRCVMLMFVIPFCRIGHIEIHGDLFDGAAAAHDERLATPGPNEVP